MIMKKLLLAAVLAVMTLNVGAEEIETEDVETEQVGGFRISAISPYAGVISGVDVKFGNKLYLGIGTNFMKNQNSANPRFVVHDKIGDRWWDDSPGISTKTTELFHISAGAAVEKISFGLHAALGRINVSGTPAYWGSVGSATSFGLGIEGAYHFFDNFFLKGSFTYFFGAENFGSYSFYDKGTVIGGDTLLYNRDDKVSIGADWKLGLAIGYRFDL